MHAIFLKPTTNTSKTKTLKSPLAIDANSFYEGIMKHCPLRSKDFSIVEESLEYVLQTDDNSEWGYILEVDLSIPDELQDYFADYPLAP